MESITLSWLKQQTESIRKKIIAIQDLLITQNQKARNQTISINKSKAHQVEFINSNIKMALIKMPQLNWEQDKN